MTKALRAALSLVVLAFASLASASNTLYWWTPISGGAAQGSSSVEGACNAWFSVLSSSGWPWKNADGLTVSGQGCTATWGGNYLTNINLSSTSDGCADGQIWDEAAQACVTPPPVTCPEGQQDTGAGCAPTTPAPTPGSSAPPIGVPMGHTDDSGNYTPGGPASDAIHGGGTLSYNCGGWVCTVGIGDFSPAPDPCVYDPASGDTVCSFVPKYTGDPASPSTPTPPALDPGVIHDPTVPAAGCPAGYTFGVDGLCHQGATPATPSTPTTPSTPANPGHVTCPSGYTQQADGSCLGAPVGPGGSTSGGGGSLGHCPPGYTVNSAGQCVSGGTVGPDGKPGGTGSGNGGGPASGGSTCGGTGQPKCEVDFGTGTMPATPDDSFDGEGFLAHMLEGPFDGLFNYSAPTIAGECPTAQWSMFDRSYIFDGHCQIYDQVSGLMSSVMNAVWLITALFIILGA